MPELPDLHVFSENLKKRILNKKIASVEIYNPRRIDTPDLFREALTGTSIQDIVRDGKELRFLLANDNCFNVHLMLNGKFFILSQNEEQSIEKISGKMTAIFLDGAQAFVIADYQGLCRVMLNPTVSYTPDALSDRFTWEYFKGVIKRCARINIKAVLISQSSVRGIGNAYVDEILYKALISPESVAGKIPEEKVKDLYEAIPFVLNEAIENIQKISPDIISGEERNFLKVHNPRRRETVVGEKIIVKKIAAKTTYFTARQKLYV